MPSRARRVPKLLRTRAGSVRGLPLRAAPADDGAMADELMMLSFVVIGLTVLATAVVGTGFPASQRLTVLLPLVAGSGAGLASLAIAFVVIPDEAADTSYASGFLVSAIVGAAVVGLTLRRLVARGREA